MTRTGADAASSPDVSAVLERLASWLRQAAPRVEWNAVALSTLVLVARHGPRRLTDLVAAERITQPGMTSLVARLEAAGLVGRDSDPTDGRATLISVTPQGLAYLDEIHKIRASTIAEHVSALSPAHQEALAHAADALAALAARPFPLGDRSR